MPNDTASLAVATVDQNLNVSHGSDDKLYVEFDTMPEYSPAESEKASKPIHKDIEIIRIYIPGKQQPTIRRVLAEDTPTQPADRKRWPKAYEAFKNKVTLAPQGFAVEAWAIITKSDAMNLKAFNIHTVEQLAEASDNALDMVPGGRGMRNKAQAYLKDAGTGKEVIKQAAKITELEGTVKELRDQLAEMKKLVEAKTTGSGKKQD